MMLFKTWLYGKEQRHHSAKHLLLCSTEERKPYGLVLYANDQRYIIVDKTATQKGLLWTHTSLEYSWKILFQ